MSVKAWRPWVFGEDIPWAAKGYVTNDGTCGFPGCARPARVIRVKRKTGAPRLAVGRWCSAHQKQRDRHGPDGMKEIVERRRPGVTTCRKCPQPVHRDRGGKSTGYCYGHFRSSSNERDRKRRKKT